MPNGTLKLYNKQTNALLVSLDILSTFNIEDNLNETPSNMKVKVITNNTYREEFEVNTVAYHEDTNTWWVIKSDESTYITTGEYEHEIQLVEYLEFYAYRHLPNCAFAPNTYDLEDMLNRLFDIAKLSITVNYPNFLDKDKIMPFFSFENFTVANAIKNIARAINAIPKMSVNLTGFVPTLTFINRNGIDAEIKNLLDTQFPIAYEKNMNSNDQFTTRSVSNITNAKSSTLVVSPLNGGYKNITPNSAEYVPDNSKVLLPSKIDRIDFIRIYPQMSIFRRNQSTGSSTTLYTGYYFDSQIAKNAIVANVANFSIFTLAELEALTMPVPEVVAQINLNDTLGVEYSQTFFRGLYTVKSKFDFDTSNAQSAPYDTIDKVKAKTIHWTPFQNEVIMAKSFRDGMQNLQTPKHYRFVLIATKTVGGVTETIEMAPRDEVSGIFTNKVAVDKTYIQVGYYPIADIKVSIDNDNDSQDEKYFNQSGKVIDAVSVSKLITSHTNDSVEGTKIRNARHYALNDILPLGQLVRDTNQLYVVSQRSIDGHVKNGNEYYNVIYTLSRNRIARSENIIADTSVISYKTPDDNLVFRTQLYKDYIELSLQNLNQDTPYLSMTKALVLNNTLAGTNFDFTILTRNEFGSTPTIARYIKSPSVFDLHKAKLINVNWQSNNTIDYRLDQTGLSFVQTPILYTDSLGNATNFELLFLDTNNIINARAFYNANFTPTSDIIPFGDITNVSNNFYTNSVLNQSNFLIRIKEDTIDGRPYKKDPFEIPVFEYMIQGNDDYSQNGNIIIGNDLFTTFTGTLRYHYVINNTTRFTAENANKLYTNNPPPSSINRRVTFVRDLVNTPHIIDLDLFSSSAGSGLRNTNLITNVGIYATDGTTVKFLFAINDYVEDTAPGGNDKSNIRVFINNWKI